MTLQHLPCQGATSRFSARTGFGVPPESDRSGTRHDRLRSTFGGCRFPWAALVHFSEVAHSSSHEAQNRLPSGRRRSFGCPSLHLAGLAARCPWDRRGQPNERGHGNERRHERARHRGSRGHGRNQRHGWSRRRFFGKRRFRRGRRRSDGWRLGRGFRRRGRRHWRQRREFRCALRRGHDARGVRDEDRLSLGVLRPGRLQLPGHRLLRPIRALRRRRSRRLRGTERQLRGDDAALRRPGVRRIGRGVLLRGVRPAERLRAEDVLPS